MRHAYIQTHLCLSQQNNNAFEEFCTVAQDIAFYCAFPSQNASLLRQYFIIWSFSSSANLELLHPHRSRIVTIIRVFVVVLSCFGCLRLPAAMAVYHSHFHGHLVKCAWRLHHSWLSIILTVTLLVWFAVVVVVVSVPSPTVVFCFILLEFCFVALLRLLSAYA